MDPSSGNPSPVRPSDAPRAAASGQASIPPPASASAAPSATSTGKLAAIPPDDAQAAAERRQRELLSEFTRSLVQTMNRTSYYEPGHPAHYAVRDDLFQKLQEVMQGQPQVGFLLQRGRTPEIAVDGLASGRKKLSELLMPGVYDIFVPRFIEYFDRYELVLLAFREGITLEEFGQFVAVMTRPVRREDRLELSPLLLEAGVVHMSVLSASDLDTIDHELPWQVRICLARLLRDLRTIPLFRDRKVEEIARAKRQIFADVVRPLVHVGDLKLLVLNAPKIQDYIENVEELHDLHIPEMVVKVLTHRRLVDLTRLLAEDLVKTPPDSREYDVLKDSVLLAVQRLIDEKVADAEPLFRFLYEQQIIAMEQLPEDLQEWLSAEGIALAREQGDDAPLPQETERDLRVLGKVARLSYLRERFEDAVEAVRLLREAAERGGERGLVANQAIERILDEHELDELVARYEANARLESHRYLLLALGRFAARALVKAVVVAGDHARFGPAWTVLDGMPDEALDAVASALGRGDLKAAACRALLALGSKHTHAGIADAAARWVHHEEAAVRLAAMAAMLRGGHAGVAAAMKDALRDESPEVTLLAMKELAGKFGAIDLVQDRCVELLAGSNPGVSAELLTASMRWLASKPPAEPRRSIALSALQHAIDVEERPSATFLGFSRKAEVREQVVDAAGAAIRALGGQVAERRKSWLDWLRRD